MSAAPARYMNERVMVVSDEVDTNGTRRSREGAGVQRELPDGRNFRKLALLDNAGVRTTEPDTEASRIGRWPGCVGPAPLTVN
jgi:hypothetical protein